MRNVSAGRLPVRNMRFSVLVSVVLSVVLAVAASSSSAAVSVSTSWGAPSWSVTAMGSSNPFGGTSIERGGGGNKYTYSVKNTKALSEGETLVCRTGEWGASPTGFALQWLRNGVAIGGATSGTYTLTAADQGTSVQCQVTGTNASGTSAVFTLTPVVILPVPANALPAPGSPSVTGTFNVGVSLTCNSGTWTGTPAPTFTYKWYRNGNPIAGAEASKYTLVAADLGTVVQCQVLGTNANGAAVRYTSSTLVVLAPPSWSVAPAVTGTATVGKELSCSNGTWTGAPTFTYQWLRGGTEIAGATANKYTIVAADEGKALQCVVTATNSDGVGSGISANAVVAPVPATPPPTPGSPSFGESALGSELHCRHETWGNSPATFTYQWLRNGAPIAGANSGPTPSTQEFYSYTVVAADVGKTLQCEVTATNSGGSAVGISRVSASVVNAATTFQSTVALAGVTSHVGETLSCSEGTWNERPTEFGYQWLRNGTAIAGATGTEYKLVAADQGAAIQCRVVAGNTSPDSVVAVSTSLLVSSVAASTPPVLAVAPVLAGSPVEEGKELSCSTGVWSGEPVLTRQWLRNGTAIAGATGETYKLGGAAGNSSEDAGKAIQCQITASNAGGASVAYTTRSVVKTEPTNPKAPSATVEPKIGLPVPSVTDVLPAGMTLGHPNETGPFTVPAGWVCFAAGVKCTKSDPMLLGESVSFTVAVRASAGTPDSATNEVVVSGGGASSASLQYPTVITAAEQFGFESFWASVTEELGTPFSQSVGHPYEATTTFVFKSTTNEKGQLVSAGGDAKNIEVLLPPGFVGSPELAPQCEVAKFERHGCPQDSAIGYVTVGGGFESGIAIVGGKRGISHFGPPGGPGAGGIVYNLAAPPGSPAAFGFAILSLNVYLTATVRSDSDYGVTVIAPDVPMSPEILGSTFTFCANGVSMGTNTLGGGIPGKCKAATPNSNSFLQNPAKCTGIPPVTTVRMNSWQHPGQEESISAYTGLNLVEGAASASESLVTGCDKLSFEPSIEPVPLNTEADVGTGVSVFLKVPQHIKIEEKVGSTLTCMPGEWTGNPTGFTYQWYVNGEAGATGRTYVTKPEDAGKSVQCLVGATNTGGTSATLGTLNETTGETTIPTTVPPVPTTGLPVPPAAGVAAPSGTATVGSILTCVPGTWTGSPTFEYAWLRNGTPIVGATSSTYTLQAADSKTVVQCLVTGSNTAGKIAAVSANKSIAASPTPPARSTQFLAEVSVASTPGTPEIKDTSVTFPKGLSLSPSAADGLEGCTDTQFARHSLAGATCPTGSQIGTVKITTPLLTFPLEGQLFLGTPECGDPTPCNVNDASEGRMFRLFIQAIDPENGVVVKVQGVTSVDPVTGQVSASFDETPQLPFEVLELKLKNGPRAPLATPQTCGTKATRSEFVPWSTGGLGGVNGNEPVAGTPNATSETALVTDWDGKGGACPETLPFNPTFSAGTLSTQAAATTGLSVTMARGAKEQDLGGVSLHMPSGLLGSVSLVKLCEEPQAAAGTCNADSRIGTVTAGAGPGSHPFFVKGSMYLTGSYHGAPFGLSIVVPTKAGPFNLGNVVVRATVNVDPHTAELTVVSDPLPQILDGIPLRLRNVNVTVDREGFILNPTNCAPKQITATISGASPRENLSEPVKSSNVSSAFDVGGCANLAFNPSFAVSTQGKTSRADGASLTVNVGYPQGSEANIKYLKVELPKQLPSRLTTLQKACTDAQFEANPAGCPAGSVLGTAVANTPVLNGPLTGPAYFVSHGGAAFPDLEIVLQGEGVTVVVDGSTFISKQGITSTTFSAVPDAPISSFQVTLPEGPDSALAANGDLCTSKLVMPTTIIGQNGKEITQQTKIAVTGCPKAKKAALTRAQKLKAALKACKKDKSKAKRSKCVRQARKQYGPVKKSKAKSKGKKKGK